MFNTPILYIVFNRLDTIKQTFPQIKKQQPKELYITADGPRPSKPEEFDKCKAVRDWILSQIDWDCNVHTLFRDENLGCGKAVSGAITWFFENVEHGIILEDDCRADDSFFYFCELMLRKYKNDQTVKLVSGTSYLRNQIKKDGYYLSHLFYIWGWATWRRAWNEIDYSNDICPNYTLLQKNLHLMYSNSLYENWLFNMIYDTYHFRLDTWDTRLCYTYSMNNGYAISPFYNLISNVGITSSRTDVKQKFKPNKYSALFMPVCSIDFDSFNIEPCRALQKRAMKLSENAVCTIVKGKWYYTKTIIKCFYGFAKNIFITILKILHINFYENNSKLIKNIFNTNYENRCLLSYITAPFLQEKVSKFHTSFLECKTAAEIFNDLGYQVDVIDFNSKFSIDYNKYDVIYGMGRNLELSFECRKKQKRIYYATGCNPIFSNIETLLTSRRFYDKSGLYAFPASRYIFNSQDKQYLLSDRVIVLGNEFVKKTYTDFDNLQNRYSNLNAFFYKTCDINIKDKNFDSARRHLLWFGSSGCLHKGLDIAIDLCIKHRELILHICGASKLEKEFWEYYNPILADIPNIICHDFVDVESVEFKKLMEVCCFAIFPTASEGGAAALLTVMGNGGLIPLTTERAGLSLDNLMMASENTIDAFERLLKEYQTMSSSELCSLAVDIQKKICKTYTYEKYKETLTVYIKSVIQGQ